MCLCVFLFRRTCIQLDRNLCMWVGEHANWKCKLECCPCIRVRFVVFHYTIFRLWVFFPISLVWSLFCTHLFASNTILFGICFLLFFSLNIKKYNHFLIAFLLSSHQLTRLVLIYSTKIAHEVYKWFSKFLSKMFCMQSSCNERNDFVAIIFLLSSIGFIF